LREKGDADARTHAAGAAEQGHRLFNGSEQAIADGQVKAIVLNSGGANCFTGPEGFALTHQSAEKLAEALGDTSASDILVCSTGLIGELLPAGALINGISQAVARRDSSEGSGQESARAIMTTDSKPKMAQFTLTTPSGVVTLGGMAKGAGMLAPGLATMLVVITTDAHLEPAALDQALRAATRVTFDRLDSDGCMSTNDTVTLMASGASGVVPDLAEFTATLTEACRSLALQLQADAEGASHDIAITVGGAATEDEAVDVARAVSRSNLFKAAIFGNDPNWGRVLAAIGTTQAAFDPYAVDVSFNEVRLCHAGAPDLLRAHTLDALGRRLSSTLSGGGLSLRVSSNAYDTADTGVDRLSVVLTGDGDPLTATTWSNSASSLTFTGHFSDVRLGQALQRAGTLLSSAVVGATKLVIVVTTSGGYGWSPSALSAATTLKAGGALVAVVTPLAATATTFSACTYPQKAFAMMQSMATSGLFYGSQNVSGIGNTLGGILPDACA
jgi:glutamate N-acetyltransferase/amino-acid N-acetyltransferase